MLVEFSVAPIGKGESVGKEVAEALKLVEASGLPYQFHAMGTLVEGDWDSVIGLVRRCHDRVMATGAKR
ncbi:MAG: MTH1187 family thiamine-binding protein, partial [bacterium]